MIQKELERIRQRYNTDGTIAESKCNLTWIAFYYTENLMKL